MDSINFYKGVLQESKSDLFYFYKRRIRRTDSNIEMVESVLFVQRLIMKKAKWIIGIFVILLCLILGSELYQNYVGMFTNQFFYFDISTSQNRNQVYHILTEAAEKQKIGVFAVEQNTESVYHHTTVIYATKKAKLTLTSNYDISKGTKNSLFSGTTKIIFKDFVNIIDNTNISRYYFTGTKEQVTKLRDEVYTSFATSYIHKEDMTGSEWLILGVWIIATLFLLLLTWLDIQYQKKENFLLMSLGRSTQSIMSRNMLLDTIVFLGAFFTIYFLLSRYLYISYGFKLILSILFLFIILNDMLYLTLLKYDYKQILYGANMNERTLSNSYVLKAITMIGTIISLSINVSLIVENGRYLSYYESINNYREYGLLNITPELSPFDKEYENEFERIKKDIFLENYKQDKVAFSMSVANEVDGSPIIIINDNAKSLISNDKLISNIDDCDYHVFMPEEKVNLDDAQFALYTATMQFGEDIDQVSYEIIGYQSNTDVMYFDFKVSSKLSLGFDKIKNPVFVYCTLSEKQMELDSKKIENFEFGDTFNNFLFKLDKNDRNKIEHMRSVKNISYVNLVDQCNQYKSALLRVVLLNCIISGFLLLLETVIIVTIIKLEYMINAKILSLKKIFGYSIFSKNRMIFLLNLLAASISIITMVIASLMFKITEVPIVLIVGSFLTLIEVILITYNIIRLERTSVPKILKGGSL